MGQKVDGGLEHIEGLVCAVLMKTVLAGAALDVHAEHFSLAVGTAQMCLFRCLPVHANKYTVVMNIFVEQLLAHKV